MLAFYKKILCCGSSTRSRSAHPTTITKPITLSICDTCQQKFATKDAFTKHKLSCHNENSTQPINKGSSTRKDSQQNNMTETKFEETRPKRRGSDAADSSRKGKPGRNVQNNDLNNTVTPDKSLSETFLTEKNDRNNESVASKKGNLSAIPLSPIEIEVEKIIASLQLKKDPRERRAAELNFITTNIDKKTSARYLVSEQWIEDYTSYLNGENKKAPEPIDNEGLKLMVINKSLPSNIYLINEIVWRFVQKVYGGGPEIKQCNKAISFTGTGSSDRSSESHTADTFSRSESLRNSTWDTQKSSWYSGATPYLKPVGLANPSFYCYMNSCLQMLLGMTELAQYVSHEKYKALAGKEEPKFWKSMTEVVHGHFRQNNCLVPKAVRKLSLKCFDPDEQHDAHEFLLYLLSGMEDEVNLPCPKKEIEFKDPESAWTYYRKYNISLIDELLAGQLISTVTCKGCKYVSTAYDHYLDLSLPIISDKTKDLNDCLMAFQKDEEIDDSYKCEKCKASGKAVKRLTIHRCPKYLVITLKRFEVYPRKKKLRDTITFPLCNWNIKDGVTKGMNSYSLIGVIVHYGPIDSGHYVCYTKRGDDWLLCDDDNISKVDEKEVASREAYVLLYEKTSPDVPKL